MPIKHISLLLQKVLARARRYEKIVTIEGILQTAVELSKELKFQVPNNLRGKNSQRVELESLGEIPKALMEYIYSLSDQPVVDLIDLFESELPDTSSKERIVSPALGVVFRDLVKEARNGRLDPVIGREEDLSRLIRCLGRRKKSNAIITGDAGTGKTALVEKLAHAIANDDVPEYISRMPIFVLDILALASMKSQKVANILDELDISDCILFIDEIHILMDQKFNELAQILKPMLTGGHMHCIGATTRAEYMKHFADDEAFRRRFEKIDIQEVKYEEAVQILSELKGLYENHHNLVIPETTIRTMVNFSQRYLPGKMPDKCIDLMESACSHLFQRSLQKKEQLKTTDRLISYYLKGRESSKRSELSTNDVKLAIESLTGISGVSDLTYEDLLSQMKKLVVGHERELEQIVGHMVKSHNIYRSQGCLSSMLFIGKSGSGRSHIATSLCKVLFGSTESMLRIDMAYYDTPHNITRLIGAPPGYIGYESGGGILAKFARSHASGIIYLENIGNQDTAITTLFQKAIELGFVVDATGAEIDMRNYIIIGSYTSQKETRLGFQASQDPVLPVIKFITPHVLFDMLSEDRIQELIKVYLQDNSSALERKGLSIEISEEVIIHIARTSKTAGEAVQMINTFILDRLDYKDRSVRFTVKDSQVVKENHNAI